MPVKRWTDEQVLQAFEAAGRNVSDAAAALGTVDRVLHGRIRAIENRTGVPLRGRAQARVVISRDTRPNPIDLTDGVIIVGSDAHYWPGDVSTAHRAMVKLIKQLGPQIVVMNGDEFDGASVSRHGRIGWEQRPSVAQEISALQDRMQEIARAAGSKCHLLGSYGNHTSRWDTLLSARVPEVEGVPGMKFDDLLPRWNYAWAWMVNGHTLIKHRIKGGIHATWNNTAEAQVSTVTGHLHNLRITPRTTMSPLNDGSLYGVDCGMLADPWGPQFQYVEQGPRNWRAGFAVLTFADGLLMPPEVCQVVADGVAWFRGCRLEV
jgi:hypothetical protein